MGLSVQQAITFAYQAGFRGEQIVTIVSISLCECGSQACACNYDCCPPSQSCGVLQVFQAAHPGTAACAVDPACAYRLGWQISNHGTNWHPWTTYNNGCWQNHAGYVRSALAAMPAPIGSGGPGPGPPPPPDPCAGVVCAGCSTCSGGVCYGGCPAGWSCVDNACTPPPSPPPPVSSTPLLVGVLVLGGIGAAGVWEARRHPGATTRIVHALEGDVDPGFRHQVARGRRNCQAVRPRQLARRAVAVHDGFGGG